ncbi:MAG: dihydrofolate reductase, partial [Lachnospiraceae bacterium]|nr:dihydrofolate reductase [Lachnospiraceae bacterium]
MKMIVAVDRSWGIGCDGKLLAHIPEDMDFFKRHTMGNVVVMGRKTFESFPGGKALPNRINVVLTGNREWSREDAVTVHSMEELEALLKEYQKDYEIYIIGGGMVYREFLKYCDTVYVTHINKEFKADTWFPDLEKDGRFNKERALMHGSFKGLQYEICEW